jgi:hypothetical protein
MRSKGPGPRLWVSVVACVSTVISALLYLGPGQVIIADLPQPAGAIVPGVLAVLGMLACMALGAAGLRSTLPPAAPIIGVGQEVLTGNSKSTRIP